MNYTPVTPFRRTVDAAMLKHQAQVHQELPPSGANKWEVLRELSASRVAFGLSDRDMTVLQVLVSFYPKTILGGNDSDLIVHPSNASICERLNGMPNSTMRRHLSHLVQAGVIVRRDSPNGKRYARRYAEEKIAFGFDLSPLILRFNEFCAAAEAVRETAERHKRLREAVSLMRRDLEGLVEFGEETRPELLIWTEHADLAILTGRALRRKLSIDELEGLKLTLSKALETVNLVFETRNTSTKESLNERHYQNSNKDSYDFEPTLEKVKAADVSEPELDASQAAEANKAQPGNLPNIPLSLVIRACSEFKVYAPGPVKFWHELVRCADVIRPMMGISPSAWNEAKQSMGPETAAVVVVAMLERFTDIKSPGGYLRSLTMKADLGAFSCGPMIMALMRKEAS